MQESAHPPQQPSTHGHGRQLKTLRARWLGIGVAMATVLGGCAHRSPPPEAAVGGWQPQGLPNKAPTVYRWVQKEGRPALRAESRRSASLWRMRLQPAQPAPTQVRFSWWVQDLVPTGNVADQDREDASARVVFGFDGDRRRLSARNRALFDLAAALTGEEPPYATLMYVWDSELPVGTVVINPRTDRIRKIVVESGPQNLRRWRDHERDLAADFRRAFGEDPGPLLSVAVMSDSDNTRSQTRAYYGPISWPGGPTAQATEARPTAAPSAR